MSVIHEPITPFAVDLPLFQALGLQPYSIETDVYGDTIFLGEYKLPDHDKATVKISVISFGAIWWVFEVETDEDYKCVIKTGSGALSDYWESVLKVADGCFTVTAL